VTINVIVSGNLTNTKARSIVPVELNAMIYWNAALLSEFHGSLNNTAKAQYYDKIAKEWMDAVTAVLWHKEVGAWLDYDMSNSIKRDYFHPTQHCTTLDGVLRPRGKRRNREASHEISPKQKHLAPRGYPDDTGTHRRTMGLPQCVATPAAHDDRGFAQHRRRLCTKTRI
jgi:hypothetical protein